MAYLLTAAVVLTGTLAAADPLVLEAVQDRRLKYGFGLEQRAPGLLIAVDDCGYLGYSASVYVDGVGYRATVVDCCSEPGCLADCGLVADVNVPELGHRKATVILWQNERQ